MSCLVPAYFVAAWKHIMVSLPFAITGAQVDNLRQATYATGNPMGAYSSWASFAVAHHFIVFVACKRAGIPWGTAPYALLGDDIVIAHKVVAEHYLAIKAELGVSISLTKTHVSRHFFEFAKRIFVEGQEVSPFPVSS